MIIVIHNIHTGARHRHRQPSWSIFQRSRRAFMSPSRHPSTRQYIPDSPFLALVYFPSRHFWRHLIVQLDHLFKHNSHCLLPKPFFTSKFFLHPFNLVSINLLLLLLQRLHQFPPQEIRQSENALTGDYTVGSRVLPISGCFPRISFNELSGRVDFERSEYIFWVGDAAVVGGCAGIREVDVAAVAAGAGAALERG